jgi:hypothetical protein
MNQPAIRDARSGDRANRRALEAQGQHVLKGVPARWNLYRVVP